MGFKGSKLYRRVFVMIRGICFIFLFFFIFIFLFILLSLFLPQIFFFWCLGNTVPQDCGICCIYSLIFLWNTLSKIEPLLRVAVMKKLFSYDTAHTYYALNTWIIKISSFQYDVNQYFTFVCHYKGTLRSCQKATCFLGNICIRSGFKL